MSKKSLKMVRPGNFSPIKMTTILNLENKPKIGKSNEKMKDKLIDNLQNISPQSKSDLKKECTNKYKKY